MSGIVIQGSADLRARLRALADTRPFLRELQQAGVQEANAKVPRRTYNLARTIRPGSLSQTHAEIMAGGKDGVGYAAAVEFGSKAHVIVPKPGRLGRNGRPAALAWGGVRTLGGRLRVSKGVQAKPEFFARRVRHPGSRAQPYLVPGLLRALARVGPDLIIAAWNRGA